MKFLYEYKSNDFDLEVGDFFQYDNETFIAVRPLIKDGFDDYRREGYTFVNLTSNSLAYPKFDTLEELKEYLASKTDVKFFRGKDVVVNLGKPFHEI
ncbi:hypothetical protein BSK59_16105 [Paenibacillus odorifer]|uniref:hypothetical protein n=1 Tax=Paenibacillus odorifer TaxID=189426 RepID=UPI00096F12B4|nr:hypothetical protein [Paenibacillus odorifer]OME54102.1 hypothetical protein BSK59_16105 [Paenibacillus odorifer]